MAATALLREADVGTDSDAAKCLAARLCAVSDGIVPQTFPDWERAARSVGLRLLEMDTGLPVRCVICEDCVFIANTVDEQDLRARIVFGLCKALLRRSPEYTMVAGEVHARIIALVVSLLTTTGAYVTFPMCVTCLGVLHGS